MEIDVQTVVLVVLIPIVGYFFKKFDSKFDEHDKRMDSQERHLANHYVAKEDWKHELDRTNRILSEVFEKKADKELVEAKLSK